MDRPSSTRQRRVAGVTFQLVYPKETQVTILRRRFTSLMAIEEACERTNLYGHAALIRKELSNTAEEIRKWESRYLKRGQINYKWRAV